jgi:hypothetical protein
VTNLVREWSVTVTIRSHDLPESVEERYVQNVHSSVRRDWQNCRRRHAGVLMVVLL